MRDSDEVRWERTTVVDQAAVARENLFGDIQGAGEIVRIRVAQRIEYDLLSDPIGIRVHPVTMHIEGSEFSVPQGREARAAFDTALTFAEKAETEITPPDDSE